MSYLFHCLPKDVAEQIVAKHAHILIPEDLNALLKCCKDYESNSYTIPFIWTRFWIRKSMNALIQQIECLSYHFTKTKTKLKQLICLVDDLERVTNEHVKEDNYTERLKQIIQSIGKKMFILLRSTCLNVKKSNVQMAIELFEADHRISSLPLNTFDEIFQNVLNIKKLKSLFQLIRLEMSELVSLIGLCTCLNGYQLDYILLKLNEILEEILPAFIKLESQFNDVQAYSDLINPLSNDKTDSKSLKLNSNFEEIVHLKAARTKIIESLSNLNSIIDQTINMGKLEEKEKIILSDTIQCLQLTCDHLKKISNLKKNKETSQEKIIQNLNLSKFTYQSETKDKACLNESEDFPDYQIFEAVIDSDFLYEIEDTCTQEKTVIPTGLLSELKMALQEKAKEHQKREKKASKFCESEKTLENATSLIKSSISQIQEETHESMRMLLSQKQQVGLSFTKMTNNQKNVIQFLDDGESFGD